MILVFCFNYRHLSIFFFQAEDGIRDGHVTGVQTCALPILKMFENKYPHTIERRDITTNVDWLRKYRTEIPVLEINGDELKAEELNIVSLEQFLERHT